MVRLMLICLDFFSLPFLLIGLALCREIEADLSGGK